MSERLTNEEREALGRQALGGASPSPLLVRAVERIVAARMAPIRALADEWEQTPPHVKCYGLDRAHGSRLRDALAGTARCSCVVGICSEAGECCEDPDCDGVTA